MEDAVPAIPPKPSTPAIRAITRNVMAQLSIGMLLPKSRGRDIGEAAGLAGKFQTDVDNCKQGAKSRPPVGCGSLRQERLAAAGDLRGLPALPLGVIRGRRPARIAQGAGILDDL